MKPNKRLGQNFLKDKRVINKMIASANISKDDVVIEVGPGKGALTKEIALRARQVIAIEKDERAVLLLKEKFRLEVNQPWVEKVEIIHGDILDFDLLKLNNYKVIASLPFYVAAPIIRNFLESENPPKQMTLIVQKEVAQRICSKEKLNLLAVSIQFYAETKIISHISKNAFSPIPKVNASIIQLKIKEKPKINIKNFFKVVKIGFSHPRKQLVNNLANGLKIKKEEITKILIDNKINTKARAENLSISDWINIQANF